MLNLDDIFEDDDKPRKGAPHAIRLTEEQKKRVSRLINIIGNRKTAEVIRRGIDAAVTHALAHPKAKG